MSGIEISKEIKNEMSKKTPQGRDNEKQVEKIDLGYPKL